MRDETFPCKHLLGLTAQNEIDHKLQKLFYNFDYKIKLQIREK